MKCSNCGAQLDLKHQFCANCGTPRPTMEPRFAETESKFLELKNLYHSGELEKSKFESELEESMKKFKCFIVHGHDDVKRLELKNYLQNTIGLAEPIILCEKAKHMELRENNITSSALTNASSCQDKSEILELGEIP